MESFPEELHADRVIEDAKTNQKKQTNELRAQIADAFRTAKNKTKIRVDLDEEQRLDIVSQDILREELKPRKYKMEVKRDATGYYLWITIILTG